MLLVWYVPIRCFMRWQLFSGTFRLVILSQIISYSDSTVQSLSSGHDHELGMYVHVKEVQIYSNVHNLRSIVK